MYRETDWKDFLKRNFLWVENDISSQTLMYGSLLICGHRFWTAFLLHTFSIYIVLYSTLLFPFYLNLTMSNVPIFCFSARKMLMRSMNISFYSHKRITVQLLIMHNFEVWYIILYYFYQLLISKFLFYWSVFPHSRVFIKELSTNITSETSIMPSFGSN